MAGEVPPVPRLIAGDLVVDDRGEVGFVNEFHFEGVKRFYTVANHRPGFIRAWHGHRLEAKYMLAVQGTSLVGAVAIDNWQKPSPQAKVWKYVLTTGKPTILYIPPGYANGWMGLTPDARLMLFSTSTLQESLADDIRFPSRYWDIWTVEER